MYMARKENIDPWIYIWKSKTTYLLAVLTHAQCYMIVNLFIISFLHEGQRSYLKTKSDWIHRWHLKVWNLWSVMSKRMELHRGTVPGAMGRLQRIILAFGLSKCPITCGKCYCSIIHMEKLSVSATPRVTHENSEKRAYKVSKVSSPLFYSTKTGFFFCLFVCAPQDDLYNLQILLKSAGRCLLHSAIKGTAPARAERHEHQTQIPTWGGYQTGRTTNLNVTAWWCRV